MTDVLIADRSQAIRDWIESPEYDGDANLTLRNDDFVRLIIYLLSVEKTQLYITNALEAIEAAPDVARLIEGARASEKLSARISASLIKSVSSAGVSDAE